MTLFCDLDGCLADMDSGYAAIAGAPPDREKDDVDWRLVVKTPQLQAMGL